MDEDDNLDVLPVEIGTRYKIIRPLGKGAYGKVYESTDTTNGELVAIKHVSSVFQTPVQAIRALRELIILRQCNHPNICKLKNVLTPPDSSNYNDIWMVLDHGGRDLLQKEKAAKILGWNIKNVKWVLYQLILGVNYLHMSGIIHRDLKPSNILIGDKLHVTISDFGLARQINEDLKEQSLLFLSCDSPSASSSSPSSPISLRAESPLKNMTKHVVTRFYRAPELCLCQNYNEKIDVWAVGCIMSELFGSISPDGNYCQPLFPGSNSILSTKDLISSEDIKKERYDERSQIYRIMRVLGNPPKDNLDWIEDEKVKKLFLDIQLNNITPMDFTVAYNHIDESGIKLLKEMLEYNPHKRISMSDALKSDFFDEVRDEDFEKDFQPVPLKIEWEIDKTLPTSQQIEILRSYTSTEIGYYKYSYSPSQPSISSIRSTPTLKPKDSNVLNCNSNNSPCSSSDSTGSDSTNRILEGILSPLSSESDDNINFNNNNNNSRNCKVSNIFDKNDEKMMERKVITDPDREYIESTFITDNNSNNNNSNNNLMNDLKSSYVEEEEEYFIVNNKYRNDEIFNDDEDDNNNKFKESNNSNSEFLSSSLYHFRLSSPSSSHSSSQLSSTNHSYTFGNNNNNNNNNNCDDLSDSLGPSPVPLILPMSNNNNNNNNNNNISPPILSKCKNNNNSSSKISLSHSLTSPFNFNNNNNLNVNSSNLTSKDDEDDVVYKRLLHSDNQTYRKQLNNDSKIDIFSISEPK